MANQVWRGDSPAVAQVDSLTVGGTVEIGDLFIVTINGKAVSTAATTTSATTTATAIYTALLAVTTPEFAEIVWTNPSAGVVKGTARTAGKPFTLTATTTEAGGGAADAQTFTRAAVTANSGPNVWDVAANWVGGVVPVNADDVYLQNSSSSILYGLDQSAVTLTSLTIDSTFTGFVGLPKYSGSGSTAYLEYRDTYLKVGATTMNVGVGGGQATSGAGSGRIKINAGTVQYTANVLSTGSPADQGLPALTLKGTHASNAINLQQGRVGVAIEAGDTSTLAAIKLGYLTSPATDANLVLGSGVTLSSCTVTQDGGTLEVASNLSTINQYGGTLTVLKAATVTTLNVQTGTCYYQSSGTITTATVGAAGELDFSRDPRARTITNTTVYGRYTDPNKTVTWTNAASFPNGVGGNQGAQVSLGTAFSLQRS